MEQKRSGLVLWTHLFLVVSLLVCCCKERNKDCPSFFIQPKASLEVSKYCTFWGTPRGDSCAYFHEFTYWVFIVTDSLTYPTYWHKGEIFKGDNKVFFSPESSNRFFVLFDFSAEPGDTISNIEFSISLLYPDQTEPLEDYQSILVSLEEKQFSNEFDENVFKFRFSNFKVFSYEEASYQETFDVVFFVGQAAGVVGMYYSVILDGKEKKKFPVGSVEDL